MELRKGLFGIPTNAPDQYSTYNGFTFGETWNGFECPLFDKETTLKIFKDCDIPVIVKEERIFFTYDGGETEALLMEKVKYKGITITLYQMGIGWVWLKE